MKFKVIGFIICFFVFALIVGDFFEAFAQEKEEQVVKKEEAKYQTWKLPIYMQENAVGNDRGKIFITSCCQ